MLKPEPRSEDLFLISELLRALYVTDWRRVGPKRITLLSAAQKELEHQLSLHASDSAHYRPVLLARAAVLVDRLVDHDSRVPVTACLEDQMAKASSALLSKTVGATDSQFLLDIPGFGRLFSMAWEETLLLTEIRTVRPPTSVSHFENILNDLWGRIIPSPDGSTALFDHRSEFYPDPAPHFTGYGIVLCMAVSRMLRERLRLLLQGRIESIDPGCAATLGKGLILNSRNMLDTEERTVAYLVRRLRRPKREGIESLKGRNTILLFGPPGTGKTTIIPALTRFLSREYHCRSAPADWRLYVLNPRLFLRHDSYSDMLAEVSNLFSVMLHLDRCVFFLDEAEELVRSRDIEGEKFSRMFTAAMLPFLARLEQTPSVFALATNHIDKMDEAAIRKGRFAVRKGLGFLDRNSVRKLIAGKAGSLPSPLRVRCLELLVRRTVKDILDVLHDVHSVWDSTKDSARTLKALESRKPYVSLVETKQHDNNVKRYDDTCSS
jgi:DNA polymerase III delta prime subunit